MNRVVGMVAGSGLVFAASDDAGGVLGRGGYWGGRDVRVTIPSSFGEIGEVVQDKRCFIRQRAPLPRSYRRP